jgi:dipeptidyl aminopeptidase/acylaminoacyl peptidase
VSAGALVFIALLPCFALASSGIASIPVRDFARQSEFDEAKLSPTGQYLAVAMRRGDAKILVVLRHDTLDVASVLKFNAPNEVDRFYWANDERLLVSLAITFGPYEFPMSTGELHAVDADGKNGRMVFGQRVEDRDAPGRLGGPKDFVGGHSVLHLLPNDPRHVLIATYRSNRGREQISEAALLDVYNGQLRTVAYAPLRDAFMLADNDGVVRFALGRNKDFVFEVHYRRDAKAPWQRVATASIGEGQLLPVAFAGANKVYVVDNRTTDTNALALLDLESGAVQEIFHDPRVDLDRAALSEPDRVLYAVRYVPGTIGYYVIDEAKPYATILRAALAQFPNSSVEITSSTRDHSRALVHVVSDRNPGAFYEYDANDASFKRLLTARRWLDPERLAPVVPVSITARDGQPLQGYVTRSAGANGAGPMIVIPHGGPFGVSDVPLFDEIAQLFAQYGYAVLTVNYRGSSGYGRTFFTAGFGQWGGLIQRDIADATRWAISNGIADSRRIAIFGISFGAYSAVMNAILEPDLYQCAVGVSGVYDLPLMLEAGDVRRRAAGRAFLQQAIGDDAAALERSSPVQNAARINVPLFIAHGTLDVRAPVAHARELRDAVAAQGRSVEYLENAHEGHGFYDVDNRTQLYERVLAFIGRYLAVPPPTPTTP